MRDPSDTQTTDGKYRALASFLWKETLHNASLKLRSCAEDEVVGIVRSIFSPFNDSNEQSKMAASTPSNPQARAIAAARREILSTSAVLFIISIQNQSSNLTYQPIDAEKQM